MTWYIEDVAPTSHAPWRRAPSPSHGSSWVSITNSHASSIGLLYRTPVVWLAQQHWWRHLPSSFSPPPVIVSHSISRSHCVLWTMIANYYYHHCEHNCYYHHCEHNSPTWGERCILNTSKNVQGVLAPFLFNIYTLKTDWLKQPRNW